MPTVVVPQLELEVDGSVGSLDRAQARFHDFVAALEVDARATYRANLVFEELVTNALKYGADEWQPIRVYCSVALAPDALVLSFRDHGRPFDPTTFPAPTQPISLEETTLGGLGLHLVRRVVAAIDHRREGDENVTEVRVALAPM